MTRAVIWNLNQELLFCLLYFKKKKKRIPHDASGHLEF